MMLFHELASGYESMLGRAIREAQKLQARSPRDFYIFEDDELNLVVHDHLPPAGLTYLLVRSDGRVLFIPGMDSMLGPNAAAVLNFCRDYFRHLDAKG